MSKYVYDHESPYEEGYIEYDPTYDDPNYDQDEEDFS